MLSIPTYSYHVSASGGHTEWNKKRDNEKHRPRQTGFVGKDAVDVKNESSRPIFATLKQKKTVQKREGHKMYSLQQQCS